MVDFLRLASGGLHDVNDRPHCSIIGFWPYQAAPHLMFEMKQMIKALGEVYYPVSLDQIDEFAVNTLSNQITSGFESKLLLTNLHSLHSFKIEKIISAEQCDHLFTNNRGKIHKVFSDIINNSENFYWLKLTDCFVNTAAHLDHIIALRRQVEKCINIKLNHKISLDDLELNRFSLVYEREFIPTFELPVSVVIDSNLQCKRLKWCETDRNFTEDYFSKSSFLNQVVFCPIWDHLTFSSQYNLYLMYDSLTNLMASSSKQMMYDKSQSAFDYYLLAMFHQIEFMYFYPFDCILRRYAEESEDVFDSFKQEYPKDINTRTLLDLLNFLTEAKVVIFSLRKNLLKVTTHEKLINVDTILSTQAARIERFLRSDILEQIKDLLILRDQFAQNAMEGKSKIDRVQFVNSAILIMEKLISNNSDNIFLKLCEINDLKLESNRSAQECIRDIINQSSTHLSKKIA